MNAKNQKRILLGLCLAALALPLACSDSGNGTPAAPATPQIVEGKCEIATGAETPEYLTYIGCTPDFEALASEPINSSLPGARSTKVVLDTADANALYFQNSVKYQIHYEFASTHLSGNGLPVVPDLAQFNTTEYYTPDRRFLLGAVTHYEGPKVWALEVAPYDTASAEMITTLYRTVKNNAFFGPGLAFHPTSEAVAAEAKKLPADVPVITTDDLYANIDYQPLSLGAGIGKLHFTYAANLETEYVSPETILVLDQAPNDISVVQGLITETFQTPLSHVNVLSQNRHTPNMGLRNALTNEKLKALDGKLVELSVSAESWDVREVTLAEAQAYWDAHKPAPVTLPALDLSVTGLVNIEDVTPEPAAGETLRDSIKKAVNAFGGKAAHYSLLARTKDVPIQKAFAVPVFYYDQFMKQNGFYDMVNGFLADPKFLADSSVRDQKLAEMRAAMMTAPVDDAFQAELKTKIETEYAGHKMRFRTSTNSEDLDGFPCAGCYESHSGDPAVWTDVLDAIRETYSSAWLFRTFEERTYYSIDHQSVGMALLVHWNFPHEEANGVAVTNNPFDASGLDPAFYVNVQFGGDVEVVAPPPGTTSDQFLSFFHEPNQPITYIAHSNLIAPGKTVLTAKQIHELGLALDAIHERFSPAYGPAAGNNGWYAMDIEFKFDDDANPTLPPALYVKQARPYPGRGN